MTRFIARIVFSVSLACVLMAGMAPLIAQSAVRDSLKVKAKHSPKTATLLALIPGAGQIYNKKYWKLPIVYAGFAATGYAAYFYGSEYKRYNEAYVCKANAEVPEDCQNELAQKYPVADLKSYRDFYRRNMELSYIVMGAWYILQILDAVVDAHLYYWEVDEDISVEWQPVMQTIPGTKPIPDRQMGFNGLTVKVNF